jgi:acid phosphatase (class A)
MKLPASLGLLALLLPCFAPAPALRAADPGHFLDPSAFDFKAVLPDPPAPRSLAAQADLEAVRAVEASRTAADVAWARRIENYNEFDFADVLGAWFTAANLPATAKLLDDAAEDSEATLARAKGHYERPRPPVLDPTLRPCVKVPASASYPSGHSTRAFVWAELLSEMFPERREALVAWAHRAAWARIIGGVHFPTDDVGGQLLARAVLQEFQKSPAFRSELEQAQAEVAAYRLRKAA